MIAYDRRGYSNSSPGARVSLAQHAADAAAIIDHLQAAPAAVVGVSAGATIALQLAATRPDALSGMVLHETPFHGKRHPNLDTIRAIIRMQRMAKRGDHVGAMESFVRWAYTYRTGGSAYDRFPEAWRDVARRNAEATLNDVGFATGESIRRRQLAGLSIPVICTVGELGRLSSCRLMQRLVSWLPGASLEVVAGAGHDVAFDNPMEFARHVKKLAVSRVENTAPGPAG